MRASLLPGGLKAASLSLLGVGLLAATPAAAQKSGGVIHVASVASFQPAPYMAVYAASKNAARAISEGLRQEAGESIRVTTVSPGPISRAAMASRSRPPPKSTFRWERASNPSDVRRYSMNTELPISM